MVMFTEFDTSNIFCRHRMTWMEPFLRCRIRNQNLHRRQRFRWKTVRANIQWWECKCYCHSLSFVAVFYCASIKLIKFLTCNRISHIGKNTGSGHYVAHIKRDGKWFIFNDEKVALSENPPLQHAYLYLFQRTDTVGSPNPEYH